MCGTRELTQSFERPKGRDIRRKCRNAPASRLAVIRFAPQYSSRDAALAISSRSYRRLTDRKSEVGTWPSSIAKS